MTDDDAALILRVLDGDRSAYATLVERYLRAGLAVAWEFADERADAEDILQDAFVRALEGLPRFDATRPFPPWFFTIVRNCGRNRATARRRWVPLSGVGPTPSSRRPEPGGDAVGPSQIPLAGDPWPEVERRLDAQRILALLPSAVERLSERQRRCFRLCDLEGFETREVAVMLGMAEATVRVHLHRARKALRQDLAPDLSEGKEIP